VSSGREKIVAALLTYGVSPDTTNSGGQTALHYAVSSCVACCAQVSVMYPAVVSAATKALSAKHCNNCTAVLVHAATVWLLLCMLPAQLCCRGGGLARCSFEQWVDGIVAMAYLVT
jgi:hypothetical protein